MDGAGGAGWGGRAVAIYVNQRIRLKERQAKKGNEKRLPEERVRKMADTPKDARERISRGLRGRRGGLQEAYGK